MAELNVCCIGDIVGRPGRNILRSHLVEIQREYDVHFTVANIENAAAGFGFTKKVYDELSKCGVDAFTSGNHVYDKRDVMKIFNDFSMLVRPLNFPKGHPGKGVRFFNVHNTRIAVVNIIGRVFMGLSDCPFETMDNHLDEIRKQADIILVDMHAEATSEKIAMGHFLNGRVSALWGTHTHVQTADDMLLSKGTAYITDLGMTGSHNSVLGMDAKGIVKKCRDQLPMQFKPSMEKPWKINGIVLRIDTHSGNATSIMRIQWGESND